LKNEQEVAISQGVPDIQHAGKYAAAKALAADALLLFPWFLVGLLAMLPAIREGRVDFRAPYATGYIVRSGHGSEVYEYAAQKRFQDAFVSQQDLAFPCIRPAYQGLVFAPLSLLPFHQAYFVFYAINLGILYFCFRLLAPYSANLARAWPHLPATMFLFLPVSVALVQGQDTILVLGLLMGALVCIRRKREGTAGVLVALGLIKFQLVLPIALLFLVWRRWRFSAGFACTAALLGAVSIWIAGVGQSIRFVSSMIRMGSSLNYSSGSPLQMSLMANLHGAWCGLLGRSALVLPLTLATSAAILIYAGWRRPQGADALLFAIPVSVLVSYHLFPHDLCILLIPIVVVFNRLMEQKATGSRSERLHLITLAALFVAPMFLLLAADRFWICSIPLLAFTLSLSGRQWIGVA
jgi:hypothetical protein